MAKTTRDIGRKAGEQDAPARLSEARPVRGTPAKAEVNSSTSTNGSTNTAAGQKRKREASSMRPALLTGSISDNNSEPSDSSGTDDDRLGSIRLGGELADDCLAQSVRRSLRIRELRSTGTTPEPTPLTGSSETSPRKKARLYTTPEIAEPPLQHDADDINSHAARENAQFIAQSALRLLENTALDRASNAELRARNTESPSLGSTNSSLSPEEAARILQRLSMAPQPAHEPGTFRVVRQRSQLAAIQQPMVPGTTPAPVSLPPFTIFPSRLRGRFGTIFIPTSLRDEAMNHPSLDNCRFRGDLSGNLPMTEAYINSNWEVMAIPGSRVGSVESDK
ncbi:hypothetical protein F4802DRAFT_602393 [Xylaria palmicola]|nr:hypothetical protein F4802DRAFT_602393 [Xylaria palmicola]